MKGDNDELIKMLVSSIKTIRKRTNNKKEEER